MKTTTVMVSLVLSTLALTVKAQIQITTSAGLQYAVVQRDGSSRVWQATESVTNPVTGVVTQKTHQYTELGDGICYQDATGNYVDAQDVIEVTPTGAQAIHGQTKAYFKPNLNTPGAVTLVTRSGQVFANRPIGLYYFDAVSGKTALIAPLQDSIGVVVPPNQVVYSNAFGGLADVVYIWAHNGFEQNVVLRAAPPPPDAPPFNLNPATTRLQVWTEYLNPPPLNNQRPVLLEQETDPVLRQAMVEPDLIDHLLQFKEMFFPVGAVFLSNPALSPGPGQPVPIRVHSRSDPGVVFSAKNWRVTGNGAVLVESTPYGELLPMLKTLKQAAVQKTGEPMRERIAHRGAPDNPILAQGCGQPLQDATTGTSALPRVRRGSPAQLAAQNLASKATQTISVASGPYRAAGIVLDYVTVPSSYDYDYTFETGVTYFVNSGTYFSGTVTFSAGCIIKFADNCSLLIYGSIVCDGTTGNPSILTDYHESLFGELIDGWATACPAPSASPALWDYYIPANLPINCMRFRFARQAIEFDANGCNAYTHSVYGCTFEECQTAIYALNCDVAIWDSTQSDVTTPTAGASEGCCSFTGVLTDIGNIDADGDYLLDSQDYKYFGRLGTLPGNIVGQTAVWTRGFSPSTAQPIWSSRDDVSGRYVYNLNCWLYGVRGLTAFSPWNSYGWNGEGGDVRGGTLITPRHAVIAAHFYIPSGAVVRFVGSDNTTYSRTCLAWARITDNSDYAVMVLDSDLPASVGYVRVLPWEAVHKMTPSMAYAGPVQCFSTSIPGVGFNQRKEAFVTDLVILQQILAQPPYGDAATEPSIWFPDWGSYCYRTQTCSCNATPGAPPSELTAGDSGSPFCVIINSELVLIGPWWQCTNSSWQENSLGALNQTIVSLDTQVFGQWTGYSATVFPVSDFPSLW